MTFTEQKEQIEQSHAAMMAAAIAAEDARIDLERRTEAAQKLFESEYTEPDWRAITSPLTEAAEAVIQGKPGLDDWQRQFREGHVAAVAAVKPVEKFFHSSLVDEWRRWLKDLDSIFGRAAGARNAAERESFSGDFGGLKGRPGWFHSKTTKPRGKTPMGELLNDAVALAQLLPRADLDKYME